MRQGNPNKRLRGRNGGGGNNNNNRKGPNPLTRTYESNGPDVKIRGTALHIAEKYVQLARDAQAIGDTVMGENYLQHAEHYYRIIAAANANSPNPVFIRTEEDMQAEDDYEAAPRAEPRFEAGRNEGGRGDGGRNEGGRGEGGRGDGNRGGDAPYQRPVRGSRHERVVFNNGDPTVPAVPGLGPQPVVSVPRFVPEAVVPAAAAAAPVSAPVPEAPVAAPEAAVEAVAEPVTAEPEEAPARRPRARVARTPRRAPAAAPEEAVEIEAPEAAPEEAAAGDEAPRPRRRVRGSRGRGRRAEAGAAEASAGEDALPVATE